MIKLKENLKKVEMTGVLMENLLLRKCYHLLNQEEWMQKQQENNLIWQMLTNQVPSLKRNCKRLLVEKVKIDVSENKL